MRQEIEVSALLRKISDLIDMKITGAQPQTSSIEFVVYGLPGAVYAKISFEHAAGVFKLELLKVLPPAKIIPL